MLKTYAFKFYGDIYNVAPIIGRYSSNNVLAINLVDVATDEVFDTLTVNLVDEYIPGDNYSFVDTNNLGQDILQFIESNKLGELVGYYGMSGFCVYPLYKFDLSKCNTEQDVEEFYKNGGEFDA